MATNRAVQGWGEEKQLDKEKALAMSRSFLGGGLKKRGERDEHPWPPHPPAIEEDERAERG